MATNKIIVLITVGIAWIKNAAPLATNPKATVKGLEKKTAAIANRADEFAFKTASINNTNTINIIINTINVAREATLDPINDLTIRTPTKKINNAL